LVRHTSALSPSTPIALTEAERLISVQRMDDLLERVMRDFHHSRGDADVVVVEGLVDSAESSGEAELNRELVRTLGAEVIVIGALKDTPPEEFEARMELTASRYGGFGPGKVIGTIINRIQHAEGR